jgi:hypothetical protein
MRAENLRAKGLPTRRTSKGKDNRSGLWVKRPDGNIRPLRRVTPIGRLPKGTTLILDKMADPGKPNAAIYPEHIETLSEAMRRGYRSFVRVAKERSGEITGYSVVKLSRPLTPGQVLALKGSVTPNAGAPETSFDPATREARMKEALRSYSGLRLAITRRPMPGYGFDRQQMRFVKKE